MCSQHLRIQGLTLDVEDIDRFCMWLDESQDRFDVSRKNRLRVNLLMEEILIRMHDQLGAEAELQASCDSRFGRPRLRVRVAGEPYNPLGGVEPELGEWDSSLRTAISLTPQYSYESGYNTLRLPLPNAQMNPVLRIAIAIAIGVAFGLVGSAVIPAEFRTSIADLLLEPIYEIWLRILNAISGPIIFCTVVTTMLNTRRIDESGGSSILVIVRYFLLSVFVAFLAMLCVLPFFGVALSSLEINAEDAKKALGLLVGLFPENIVDPLMESNTSQLLFLAFLFGYVLVKLGDRTPVLRKAIQEANTIGLDVAQVVSWLVPVFTGVLLCLKLWQGRVDPLVGMWQPLVLSLAISIVFVGVLEVVLSRRLGVSASLIAHKIWPPFALAMKTGSLDGSFAETQASCTDSLGISPSFVKVGLPQGLVLYMPISAVGTIVFTLFVTGLTGVQEADLLWYVSAVLMTVIVFVATPPVPGANLLAYVVLFQTLGIPSEALLDAMVFDIVFGIFAGAANQAMLQLEMTMQANRLGLLDRDLLTNRDA